MTKQRRKLPSASGRRREWSIPMLLLAAFGLGVGMSWLVLRGSPSAPPKPAIESFFPGAAGPTSNNATRSSPAADEPPNVSQLTPAEAARTLANWNYDRQNWRHAIEHYEQAIAAGADTPDVRTDLGNCFRFLGQPAKALEQYEIAQKQDPQHENSLFNQISLLPICCRTRSGPQRPRATSSPASRKVRERSRHEN